MLTGGFWIISFVLLLVLVMVNLMLAMIFDNYGEVRENVFKNETMFVFIRRLMTQLQNQSSWIPNTEMLRRFGTLPVGATPSLKHLRREFPDLQNQQFALYFESAAQKQTQALVNTNRNQIPEYIAGLLLSLREVRRDVAKLKPSSSKENTKNQGRAIENNEGENMPRLDDMGEEPSVEIAEEAGHGTDNIDMGGAPPMIEPDWIDNGLLEHLRTQQLVMDDMIKQMNVMKSALERRGIKGKTDFSAPRPMRPDLKFVVRGANGAFTTQDRAPSRHRSQSPRSGAENASAVPLVNRPRRTYEIPHNTPGERESEPSLPSPMSKERSNKSRMGLGYSQRSSPSSRHGQSPVMSPRLSSQSGRA